jgi:hypothetical protein
MDMPKQTAFSPDEPFPWADLNLTDRQRLYCRARCEKGLTRVASYQAAGYQGDPDTSSFRSKASKMDKSPNVAFAIDLWKKWNGEKAEAALDDAEIDRQASALARSATNENVRLSALKYISDRNDQRRDVTKASAESPIAIFRRLVLRDPPLSDATLIELAHRVALPPEMLSCDRPCSHRQDAENCACQRFYSGEISNERYADAFAEFRGRQSGGDASRHSAGSNRPGGNAGTVIAIAGRGGTGRGKAPANGSGTAGPDRPALRNDALETAD